MMGSTKSSSREGAYDGSRATRELGLAYTPIEESLRRTIDSYLAQGLVTLPA